MNKQFSNRGLMASLTISILALGAAAPTAAQAPPMAAPEADLIEFFDATGGQDWLHNDGWLDPEVEVCDWFGVTCLDQQGTDEDPVIAKLDLPDNNLTGSINDLELLGYVYERLDLSGNQLSGTLDQIPFWIISVNLARNQFSGPLPDIRANVIIATPPPDFFHRLSHLRLSGNNFQGAVPDDWDRMSLSILDLSNNALDSGIENAFAAIGSGDSGELILTDNAFSGPLPPEVASTSLSVTDLPLYGGGLNLCWNNLAIDDPDLIAWINDHHVAGPGWQACQNRDRLPIDPAISGSWFSPVRPGEGVSLMLLENGFPLLYGFTYNLDADQQWFFETGRAGDLFLDWPTLLETRGDFGEGLRVVDEPLIRDVARLRLDRIGDRIMHMERVFIDHSGCAPLQEVPEPGGPVPLPCPIFPISDRLDQVQLTRLAGTSCSNQLDHQWISGAWFNPQSTGEGMVVEVIEDGRGVVYWFTYAADGSGDQVWLTGDAQFDGTTLFVDNLLQPVGTSYGPSFDADQVVKNHWGSLTLDFTSEDAATASFASVREDFGQGDFSLERLARPMLAECE